MSRLKDVIAAKDALSSRLLRSRVHDRYVPMTRALTLGAARKNAGRNLHGVGVARKIVQGKPTPTHCIRLCVVEKLRESAIPKAALLPKEIDGIPTDVVQMPALRLLCSTNRARRQRPIIGGISAAHYLVDRATLGCFCHSLVGGETTRRYMLGCNHAFANLNSGAIGDPILQPSPADGGRIPRDVAGLLDRWVDINLDGSTPNAVDAAIAKVAPGVEVVPEICRIGKLRGIRPAYEGMIVRKHGSRSGYTEGTVVSLSFDWLIPYAGPAFAQFTNQIYIEPVQPHPKFCLPGDSGSVIVAKNSLYAVGLLFAGAPNGVFGVANPIAKVCNALRIRIP